jgi:hypothetical protein
MLQQANDSKEEIAIAFFSEPPKVMYCLKTPSI